MMIHGKTKPGFEFEFDPAAMDNMELLEAIAEADQNPVMLSKVLKMVLSEDQRKRLYDHLRTEDGRVPIEAASDALKDIFAAVGQQGKN